MDVGSVPAMDAVEARYPVHVCVLFRAIAHQQARRRGVIRDVEEDDGVGRGVAGGFFRVFGFSGKSRRDADARALESSNSEPAESSGDEDMSEDDWAKLDAVFDVGARAEAAAGAQPAEGSTAPQSEATIAVGSVSLKIVDDEAETSTSADDAGDENRANSSTREVLNASVTGLVAGARSLGDGSSLDADAQPAMDLDVGGAKILRRRARRRRAPRDDSGQLWTSPTTVGSRSSEAPGCVTASRVAAALWGCESGAGDSPGGGGEGGDEDVFVDASGDSVDDPVDDSMDVETSVEPPEALTLRFEKIAKPSRTFANDPNHGPSSSPHDRIGSSSRSRRHPAQGAGRRWSGR